MRLKADVILSNTMKQQAKPPTFASKIVILCLFIALFVITWNFQKQMVSTSSKDQLVVIYVTAPNKEQAQMIGKALVQAKLAACCNIVQGINSIYLWQGKIQKDQQVMLIIKTRQNLIKKLQKRVKQMHSYQVPQVIAMPIVSGSQQYTNWVLESTSDL